MTEFPAFKPITLEDRDIIRARLREYQPETSELTFTNLFIWRAYYEINWSLYRDGLLFTFGKGDGLYALPPIGASPRQAITRLLLNWLKEQGAKEPRIERADRRLVNELGDDFRVEPAREHFDYIYRSQDLIRLAGRKYHAKRNFINAFARTYQFSYDNLTPGHISACLELTGKWCQLRRCDEDMNLAGEWAAVKEALGNFEALDLRGGVIRIGGRIEAFALGEMLNLQTAVVHIEKANPDIHGLYAVINQQFCEHNWSDVAFVNREQDLGEPALRETKLSYQPDHLVEKFRIRLRQG